MITILLAAMLVSTPCLRDPVGAPVCQLHRGVLIRLQSASFDFSEATCSVTSDDLVKCVGARVFETTVRVTVTIDYKHERVTVK